MRRVALAIAGILMFGAAPALAQYAYPPRPTMPVAGMPGDDVVGIVRGMGLNPIGLPMRSGRFYIQRVADYYGRPMRVIVDASRAQVVSVEPLGAPGSLYGSPYGGPYAAGEPYRRGPYRDYRGIAPYDDDFDGPVGPRAALGPMPPQHEPYRAGPQMQQSIHPAPKAKSAAVTPAKPPAPRKRPAAAPQETAGTVEPLKLENAAPAAQPAPAAAPAATTPAIPPVAPLE